MRKVLASIVVLCAAAAPQARAQDCVPAPPQLVTSGKLTIGSTLLTPPQNFLDGDKPAGYAVELGQAIARAMCLEAEITNMSFTGLFAALNARKIDLMLTGTAITPERQQSFDFVPYFVGGVRLIDRKDAHNRYRDSDDLCGLTVAT